MDDVAIRVENLSKDFKLPHEKTTTIKSAVINFWRHDRGYEMQHALKDVSFEIKKGEFFGIVGRNGSGKSTLLKLIAGIYSPTNGAVAVRGSLTPFIELGVGFNPELTGRENIFLNGALLGFNHKEMQAMYKDIVDFAELEKFMDQKLKNYSSGMQVRLAFSIAIRARSSILLLDEVLAVGDAAFQKKCYDYFNELKQEKRTMVLVTHDMSAVERFCDRAILIEGGKIINEGNSAKVAESYKNMFSPGAITTSSHPFPIKHRSIKEVAFEVLSSGVKSEVIEASKDITILANIDSADEVSGAAFGVNLIDSNNIPVASFGIGGAGEPPLSIKKGLNQIKLKIDENIFHNDRYRINALLVIYGKNNKTILFESEDVARFVSTGFKYRNHAITHPKHSIYCKTIKNKN